jgi:hypothetical protein
LRVSADRAAWPRPHTETNSKAGKKNSPATQAINDEAATGWCAAGACGGGVSVDKDLVPSGIDRASGEAGAILFRRKAGDDARGECSGDERSGRHTIARPRTGIVNVASFNAKHFPNAAADQSMTLAPGSVLVASGGLAGGGSGVVRCA